MAIEVIGAAPVIGLIGAVVGMGATLGAGFMAFGGLRSRVLALEIAVPAKADADRVDDMHQDIREIRTRVDQVLDRLGRK